ncbi:MAG TPA: acetyl-CoA carboxylase biotin carboxyl carrier protein subunit [Phaeodactylibacter sp.]|nr:acetyl-CoA carboxylase biotin carboxyl carrier protein subunit [Phaeodactylibacter sp.]
MKEKTFKLSVNERFSWLLRPEEVEKLDLLPLPDGGYHLLHENQSYLIRINQHHGHLLELEINGHPFEVRISDSYDQLIEKMGLHAKPHHQSGEVQAPMPGLVLKIEVKEGQQIQKDQALLILEAMKMENIIKAEGEGTVKEILVEEGQSVNKGEVLVRVD